MTYRIGLRFEDGATKIIACRPKETLVDAAMRQGVSLPIDCREGACGTCRCLVESGAVDLGDYVEDALSEVDVAQGWALACQARPTSDCVFHVPASSAVCQSKPSTIEARLTSIDKLGTKVMSITVEGPAIEALEYMPGQYAKVFLPDGSAQRAYSFSSMKTDETKLSFLIRLVPEGQMSTWLETEAKVGDKLAFQGPFGSFYLRPIQRPILMLAGGTGLGPMLAMLESLEAMGRLQQPCHLMLGVNDDDDAQ